jgi:DNA-binding transcriptional LysR family regulator
VGDRRGREQLAGLGLRRRVVMIVPHFLAAAIAVSQTDYAAAVPRRFALAAANLFSLRLVDFPFPAPRLPLSLVWHERTHASPPSRFFRALVLEALRSPPSRK